MGCGSGSRPADGQPRFVLDISPVTNTVTVGPRDALAVTRIAGIQPTWTVETPRGPWRGEVQVRAHGAPMPATIEAGRDGVDVLLDAVATGVAAGQAAVLYDGSRVVGSATISAASA